MEDRHGDAASCQRPLPLTRMQRRQLPWAGGIGVGRICLPVDSQAMIVYYMCQGWVRFSSPRVSGLMFARFACGGADTCHSDGDLAQTKADKVMPHLVSDLCH
jgi:hypothetical protein